MGVSLAYGLKSTKEDSKTGSEKTKTKYIPRECRCFLEFINDFDFDMAKMKM